MQIHFVTPANRGLYTGQLDQMYRQRRQFFVDRMKWSDLDNGSDYEIDDFDHEHAVYVLALGDLGELLGSYRLLPTWQPHLMGGPLAKYVEKSDRAKGAGVWEFSRWIPGFHKGREHREEVRGRLFVAAAEFALSHSVDAYVACVEVNVLNLLAEIGWPVEMLGEPTSYGTGTTVAIRFSLGHEELASTQMACQIASPTALELPMHVAERSIQPHVFAAMGELLCIEDDELLAEALTVCSTIAARDALIRSGDGELPLISQTVKGHA